MATLVPQSTKGAGDAREQTSERAMAMTVGAQASGDLTVPTAEVPELEAPSVAPSLELVLLAAEALEGAGAAATAAAEEEIEEIPHIEAEGVAPQVIQVAQHQDGQWVFHEEDHRDRELQKMQRLCQELLEQAKVCRCCTLVVIA